MTDKVEVKIPDIGGATDVDVIEVMVKKGDSLTQDQSMITLEGDKATMDIPAPMAGIVEEVKVKVGDKVSQGSLILLLKAEGAPAAKEEPKPAATSEPKQEQAAPVEAEKPEAAPAPVQAQEPSKAMEVSQPSVTGVIAAGPAVRRLARELGVDLSSVQGSGRKDRIVVEDIQQYVKSRLSEKSSGSWAAPSAPAIDFSQFGSIETKPLNKIKRLTGQNVHRSWITIPHVTQFDEADITELEAFRKSETDNATKNGYKLTLLSFVCKVVCKALQVFPQFNSSLDSTGEQLIYKNYYNIGIAVETPNGLVVPVIKGVDGLSVADIAKEMARLSTKAREKGLMPTDMNGGCFTISSLGGIGGTAFTPIVNSPEVAILGLSRTSMKPMYDGKQFIPRLMLPLSLSYDHRVIDGAEAARFSRYLVEALADIRKVLL